MPFKQVRVLFRDLTAGKRAMLFAALLLAGFALTVIAAQVWWVAAANEAKPARPDAANVRASLSQSCTIKFEARGSRSINLRDGKELQTACVDDAKAGTVDAEQLLSSNEAAPLTLTSDDFDEDGVPDMVCAYASPTGGILTLHRGNVDSIYPNAPEAKQRRAQGKFTDAPFLSPARVFESPAAPELIGAGDFDADGHRDLITARMGGNALWFFAGDAHGSFAEPKQITLPGIVTALEVGEINRQDGLADIVVGVAGDVRAKVLVFESPLGAINALPEEFQLPAVATSLALGEIVDGYESDLAIAAGHELIVVSGRDRKLSSDTKNQGPVEQPRVYTRSFAFNVKSIAIGNFRGDTYTDIAMLCDGGIVRINCNPTAVVSKRKKTTLDGWRTEILETELWPQASKLVRARVSSNPSDSLLVLDPQSHHLNIIDKPPEIVGKSARNTTAPSGPITFPLVSDGEPVSALPMRLGPQALHDIVVLSKGHSQPSVLLLAPTATFTVTNTGDNGGVNPGPGAGTGTLRQAIVDANANPGADAIAFSIGSGVQTISPNAALPDITEAVTLDGTTQPGFAGTPIIEINGTNVGASGLTLTGGNSTIRGLVIDRHSIGLHISGVGATGNLIQGNLIGTNFTGTAATSNTFGIIIDGAPNNTIGGTTIAARNLISGNTVNGVVIQLAGATGNVVQGNFIGTDITGTLPLGNTNFGVSINNSAASNTIGGTVAGARNVISGNADGVAIDSNNMVEGNFIGTNASGTAAVANTGAGVIVFGSGNTVGGTSAAARNIISGNGFNGMNLQPGSGNNNTIQGNFVGLDVSGTTGIPNSSSGIVVAGSNNLVGGTAAGARNVCSGNNLSGVHLLTNNAISNTVQGNLIGVNAAGTSALPNNRDGVRINGGLNNIVGGTAAGAGNVISGNPVGVNFLNSGNGNTVQGNFIGTLADGTTPLPNSGDGIKIDTSSSSNTIGGTVAAAGNVIAFNGGRGINALSGSGNGFLTNSIFSNTSLGIDLNVDGVTPNDAGDADTGPNNLQNFPVLTLATPDANTTIQGTLNSTASTAFRIEFFSSPACDASGNGEGTTFLGFSNVTSDASGNATINVTLPVSVPAGNVVVATATDPTNNTSEFSACITVAPAAGCTITCPANQTVSNDLNQCGATVNYPPATTAGSCGTVTCTPSAGSFFPKGATTVNCTTNAGPSCSFTVTVNDMQPPTITCPTVVPVIANLGSSNTVVNYPGPTANDNCSLGPVNCSPPSGSRFPVGSTTVTCTATDSSNNTASCTSTVTVLTPQQATQSLINNVNSLVAQGVLDQGEGNSLTSKLQAAIKQMDNGNGNAARNKLQAFINQVIDLKNSGTLTAAQAQALTDAANNLITHLP